MMTAMVLLIHTKMAQKKWNKVWKAMGTDVAIDIVGDDDHGAEIDETFRAIEYFFERSEQIFSRFRTNSELSVVNHNRGSYVQVSEEFIDAVARACYYHDKTNGYFDPRIYDVLVASGYREDFHTRTPYNKSDKVVFHNLQPKHMISDDIIIDRVGLLVKVEKHIDLAGLIKGWTVDQARQLINNEYDGYVIDAGGDMWIDGYDSNHKPWYIGIEGVDDEKLLFQVRDQGLATSGVTRRQWVIDGKKYHHLIDPWEQRSSSHDLSTVTVVAQTVERADVWAKVLFLMGQERGIAYANTHHIKAIWIDHDKKIYASKYIQENIVE